LNSLPDIKLAVIGLGYVGLPLAVEFGKQRSVVGFDINPKRIEQLKAGHDFTLETEPEELQAASHLQFSTHIEDLRGCNVYIVTVPTPINEHKQPDLTPLIKASETVGKVLKPGDIVIYESTVYPGCTEEDCVPVLEKFSGLKYISHGSPRSARDDGNSAHDDGNSARDDATAVIASAARQSMPPGFYCGYSPERINPGDKEHRVTTIKKVTSGSTPEIAELVDALYNQIITAGTFKATSIKVAEAAKVIENTQRDLNIALINELALIFNKMEIDTEEVLQAAGSKWNFLPFRPGLVGGHCIGVDPYYLTHKAEAIGYHPQIILAGRRLNDSMGAYVVTQLVKAMTKRRQQVDGARVLNMGLTFKENCPDLRNTRVVDIVKELADYHVKTDVFDPWASTAEAEHEYGITPVQQPELGAYDAIIIAVAHHQFKTMGAAAIRALGKPEHVLYDLKYLLPASGSDLRL
jgi:UDP-N-acetyl-D-galactosamine dehydrogenase